MLTLFCVQLAKLSGSGNTASAPHDYSFKSFEDLPAASGGVRFQSTCSPVHQVGVILCLTINLFLRNVCAPTARVARTFTLL